MINFTPALKLYFVIFFAFISSKLFSQSIANYNISVTTIWNSENHTSVPAGAHWSPLVGATHKNINDIVNLSKPSPLTNGLKDVAERGINTNFNNEINTVIASGNADKYLIENFSSGAIATATMHNVMVSEDFPLVTLISMVAPSPDWFIAVTNENLRSGLLTLNGWKDTYTIDVFAYDAGTDNGTNYNASNSANTPRTNIFKINNAPINGNKMATLTFTYNASTLSNREPNAIAGVKISPNPTNSIITLSNIQNINLKNIEIYSTIGNMVKQISTLKSLKTIKIDVSNLNKGIYLVKLNLENGSFKTQKIAIN
ncbi:hypothetical protein GCM10022291_18900 [Postechiella marina]|uniref:Spondin domain-containing protein n=1 Tax=Postechiella marina TaxID=943941 RepID=A0ABP8C917_9FLAO